uniref:Uncharacterized protein n=1 Tax=Oryza rufipogon TaxID=4529 RepID=A0A0E0RH23_ORYRU
MVWRRQRAQHRVEDGGGQVEIGGCLEVIVRRSSLQIWQRQRKAGTGGDGSEKTMMAARAEGGSNWVEVIGCHEKAERRARPRGRMLRVGRPIVRKYRMPDLSLPRTYACMHAQISIVSTLVD